jgi:predicted kinase
MNNIEFLQQVLKGATPNIDQFVDILGDRFSLLREYQSTPQDCEWHAEGNVHIHTGMVLNETYQILQTEATHLTPQRRLSLILGALFHDIYKPIATQEQEIDGKIRIVAPQHASKGRSYLALKLMGLDLPYSVVENTLSLVAYHHAPQKLVTHNKYAGEYQKIARLSDPELLYWLELANIRGRECQDREQQLEIIELYSSLAQKYRAWQAFGAEYQPWRAYFNCELADWNQDTRNLVFAQAIARYETDQICTLVSELARSHSDRDAFPQVVITFGVSGSGKSTWIENYLADHTVISLDTLRSKIASSRSDQSQNSKIVRVAKEQLRTLLRSQSKIVWDATSLKYDFRQQIVSLSRQYGALITLVIFHCPETIYLERNRQRRHSIPEEVLLKQLQSLEFPELNEGDRTIIVDEHGNTLATHGTCY